MVFEKVSDNFNKQQLVYVDIILKLLNSRSDLENLPNACVLSESYSIKQMLRPKKNNVQVVETY